MLLSALLRFWAFLFVFTVLSEIKYAQQQTRQTVSESVQRWKGLAESTTSSSALGARMEVPGLSGFILCLHLRL